MTDAKLESALFQVHQQVLEIRYRLQSLAHLLQIASFGLSHDVGQETDLGRIRTVLKEEDIQTKGNGS